MPVIVFDGVCLLCSRSVRFVLRHDRTRLYRFATAQSEAGRALLLAHGIDPDAPVSVLLVADGRAYTQSAAVLRVLADCGAGWRFAARVLGWLPHGARDRLYRWIARRRYAWFGRSQTCFLPDAQDAGRFLSR